MNKFISEIIGFYNYSINYGHIDSLYLEKKYRDVLDKANLFGKILCQSKIDYESGGAFYGFFLAPKIKCVLTKNGFGIIQQRMTFKVFNDSKRLKGRSQ